MAGEVEALMDDDCRRQELGRRAREAVVSRRGVVGRSLDAMGRFGFKTGAAVSSSGDAARGRV